MELLDALSNVLYTPENIARANNYVTGRGLDPSRFRFPFAASGPDPARFYGFDAIARPYLLTNTLYMPILDLFDPEGKRLIGFDMRYLGEKENRLRYRKIKRNPTDPLLYNVHEALTRPQLPLVVCEGVIDVESLRLLDLPCNVISPLTATTNDELIIALVALSQKILIAYDNDSKGRNAKTKFNNILAPFKSSVEVRSLTFLGPDLNQALQDRGAGFLKQLIRPQIR